MALGPEAWASLPHLEPSWAIGLVTSKWPGPPRRQGSACQASEPPLVGVLVSGGTGDGGEASHRLPLHPGGGNLSHSHWEGLAAGRGGALS